MSANPPYDGAAVVLTHDEILACVVALDRDAEESREMGTASDSLSAREKLREALEGIS
jgi:hypothetical protein